MKLEENMYVRTKDGRIDKIIIDYNDPFYGFGWDNEDIKSIVTHEQFEQISYKLGE